MHLLPVIIIIITLWYYKIVRQLLGKFALIVFIFLSLTMFLVNPKEVPGKKELLSIYRSIYDILKLDVNPENKILIAPVIIYSADCGFQSDLYFGENAIYMVDLPIKDTYDLKSLKELLKDMNIRYVFLARKLLLQLLEPGYPLPYFKNYRGWLRNEKDPYSLRKDLEIIQAYIRNKGGLLINQNAFGKIYYLTGEQAVQKKTGLIANGSFEYWWKGLPMGEWVLVSGRISRSREEFTQGSSSIRLEPDDKKGTRLKWVFNNPLLLPEGKDKVKVKVRLDAKSAESKRFFVVFNAYVNKKWKKLGSGIIRYTGEGEWVTISEEFTITPGMKFLNFNLWLWAGAREPAFVDNLSIRIED